MTTQSTKQERIRLLVLALNQLVTINSCKMSETIVVCGYKCGFEMKLFLLMGLFEGFFALPFSLSVNRPESEVI